MRGSRQLSALDLRPTRSEGWRCRDVATSASPSLLAVGCSSLGTLSTRFTPLVGGPPSTDRRDAAHDGGDAYCVAKQVTKPIRNREAPAPSRN
jgi:hypothetical protein